MANLTDSLSNLNSRVTALENSDLDDAAGVARITKTYGNIKITATITTNVHQYNICSTSLYCSESLKI